MVLESTHGPSEEEQSRLQTAPKKFISTALDVLPSSTRRRQENVEFFDYDILILQIHTPGHWSFVMVNLEKGKLVYHDSLHGDGTKHVNLIKDFVAEYAVERGYATEDRSSDFMTVDPSNWLCCCPKDIPKQQNGLDCGVFVCKFAECVSRRGRMEFTQPQIAVIRRRVVLEMLSPCVILFKCYCLSFTYLTFYKVIQLLMELSNL